MVRVKKSSCYWLKLAVLVPNTAGDVLSPRQKYWLSPHTRLEIVLFLNIKYPVVYHLLLLI